MNIAQFSTHDYMVRVKASELGGIVLDHLYTEQDPGVLGDAQRAYGSSRAGITEWTGQIAACAVTLAWDWCELDDGEIRLLRHVAPRANIMPLDPKGYDMPAQEAVEALWALVERQPWRGEVAGVLAASAPRERALCGALGPAAGYPYR